MHFKKVSYMCPKCYGLERDVVVDEYSGSTWVVQSVCPICGEMAPRIELDQNIADVIVILNKKGYGTLYCCEGHGAHDYGYIAFAMDYSEEMDGIKAPKGWYFDIKGNRVNRKKVSVLREKEGRRGEHPYDLADRITGLCKWAESLKPLGQWYKVKGGNLCFIF